MNLVSLARRLLIPTVALMAAVGVATAGEPGVSLAAATASTPPADGSTTVATTAEDPALAPASWTVRPGPEQVAVLDAAPGAALVLVSVAGPRTESTVDEQGAVLFRGVDPGRYHLEDPAARLASPPFDVPGLDVVPPHSFYDARVLPAPGFGYLETRDGTTLSVNVILPGPVEDGPYPTVVEYSAYQPSDPAAAAGFPQVFTTLGYAYVGVNMRGSGCSGGSYQYFEPVQLLDGYDAIETIAAQPWVDGHRVGMVGVSYPGISQLFVASTQPPSLAAITPFSVIDDSAAGVIYPGGILNTGFAVEWTQARTNETQPEGQAWTTARIEAGDAQCAENQRLRRQNPDLVQLIRANPFWTDDVAAPIAPRLLVGRIQVPTFVAGAWQDEQTGGRFATMLDRFTGTDHFYASLVNGLHTESIGAGTFARYVEFLDLYVGHRVPSLDAARTIVPVLGTTIFGTDQLVLPPDRFRGLTYDEARARFEADPPIEVLFEEGAADGQVAGAPMPRWVSGFDAWPIPGTTATSWYLDGDALTTTVPTAAGAQTYRADPAARPATFFDDSGGALWAHDVTWDWRQPPPGTAASFVSAPFETETTFVGSASADLWIRSAAADTDLQVTLSEVRPDGQEVYVQSGWLRASQRALDPAASTELRPVATHREADAAPLPAGEWTPVRIEIFPFAHVVRPGSQLRLTVTAPGNDRAQWVFETIAASEAVEVAWGPDTPSRLVLPVVPGVDAPDSLPPCTLRGQPCRPAG